MLRLDRSIQFLLDSPVKPGNDGRAIFSCRVNIIEMSFGLTLAGVKRFVVIMSHFPHFIIILCSEQVWNLSFFSLQNAGCKAVDTGLDAG
jgi:hypothetical protein